MVKKHQIPVSPSILKYAKLSTRMKSKGKEPSIRHSPKGSHLLLHGSSPLQIPLIEEMDIIPAPTNEKTPIKPIASVIGAPSVRKKRSAIVVEGVRKKIRLSTDNPGRVYQAIVRYAEKVSSSPISTSSYESSPNNVVSAINESKDRKKLVPSGKQPKCKTSNFQNQHDAPKIEPMGHPTSGSSKTIRATPSNSSSNKIDICRKDSLPRVMRKRGNVDYSGEKYNILQSSLGAVGHNSVQAKTSDIFGDQTETSDEESGLKERSLGSKDSKWSEKTPELAGSDDDSEQEDSDTDEDDSDEESNSENGSESEDEETLSWKSNRVTKSKGFYVRTKESNPMFKQADSEKLDKNIQRKDSLKPTSNQKGGYPKKSAHQSRRSYPELHEEEFSQSYEIKKKDVEIALKDFRCKTKKFDGSVCDYSTLKKDSARKHMLSHHENLKNPILEKVFEITPIRRISHTTVYSCKLMSPEDPKTKCKIDHRTLLDLKVSHFLPIHKGIPRRGPKRTKEEKTELGRKSALMGLAAEIECIPLIAKRLKINIDQIKHIPGVKFNLVDDDGNFRVTKGSNKRGSSRSVGSVQADYEITIGGEKILGELKSTDDKIPARMHFRREKFETYRVNANGDDEVTPRHKHYNKLVRLLHCRNVYNKVILFLRTGGLDGKGNLHLAYLFKTEETRNHYYSMLKPL